MNFRDLVYNWGSNQNKVLWVVVRTEWDNRYKMPSPYWEHCLAHTEQSLSLASHNNHLHTDKLRLTFNMWRKWMLHMHWGAPSGRISGFRLKCLQNKPTHLPSDFPKYCQMGYNSTEHIPAWHLLSRRHGNTWNKCWSSTGGWGQPWKARGNGVLATINLFGSLTSLANFSL